MAEFNYTEYIKNNPLLQEEVKDKLLTESQKVSEGKTIDVYDDGDVIIDISKATPEQERLINFELEISEFGDSAEAQEVADQIMGLKSADDVENYYANIRGWDDSDDMRGMVRSAVDVFRGLEEKSSKTTVSELKAQIREMILASLQEEKPVAEADEDEDVEVDVEDEIDAEVDVEPEMDAEPAMDAPEGGSEGLTADEKEIQDSLKLAYDNAVAIGDQKLADQIGNSITFFTRTHVVER